MLNRWAHMLREHCNRQREVWTQSLNGIGSVPIGLLVKVVDLVRFARSHVYTEAL